MWSVLASSYTFYKPPKNGPKFQLTWVLYVRMMWDPRSLRWTVANYFAISGSKWPSNLAVIRPTTACHLKCWGVSSIHAFPCCRLLCFNLNKRTWAIRFDSLGYKLNWYRPNEWLWATYPKWCNNWIEHKGFTLSKPWMVVQSKLSHPEGLNLHFS